MKWTALATLAIFGLAAVSVEVSAAQIQPAEWRSYVDNFVADNGRVIDKANGEISHSEGQGYGLILAVLSDDRPSFERIWSFTQTELMVRPDGLSAWSWQPNAKPHIADTNNATDGDILIAYGLLLAAQQWQDQAFYDRALAMIATIGRTMIVATEAGPAILPGQYGFLPEDGSAPIVNPSYWVFEAIAAFAQVDSSADWKAINKSGLDLLRRAAVSKTGVPGDWVQLKDGAAVSAPNLPAEFGYNNIRIPLYLMRAGADAGFLGPFRRAFSTQGLAKINVTTGARIEPISEPGYQLITAAMDCVAAGTPIPASLSRFEPTSYYAATLQLLLLDYLRRTQTACLAGGS